MLIYSLIISPIAISDSLTHLGQQQNEKEHILIFGYFKVCNNVNLILK